MAGNFIQPGNTMDYTNTTSDPIASGAVVPLDDCIGVALVDIPIGATGALQLTGVFAIPKKAEALTQGHKVYWDDGCTATSGDIVAGRVWESAAAGDSLVPVKLAG